MNLSCAGVCAFQWWWIGALVFVFVSGWGMLRFGRWWDEE